MLLNSYIKSSSLNPLSNQGHSILNMIYVINNNMINCLNPLSNQGHSIIKVEEKYSLKGCIVLIPLVIRVIQSGLNNYFIGV